MERAGRRVVGEAPSEAARRCRVAAWSIVVLALTIAVGALSVLAIGRKGFADHETAYETALLLHLHAGAVVAGMAALTWRGRRFDGVLICFALLIPLALLCLIGLASELPFEWPVAWLLVLMGLYLAVGVRCLVNLIRTWMAMSPRQRTPGRGFG